MARISLRWRYNLSTPSTEGGGNMSKSMAVAARFRLALVKVEHWPPSQLMLGATPLA
jgi:hypothetical protein